MSPSMSDDRVASATKLIREELLGEEIASWECHSVNGTKSILQLSALKGEMLTGVDDEGGLLRLTTHRYVVSIDLARTGRVVLQRQLEPWVPSPSKRPPTARLVLASGRGVDFVEPGKTKRIAFTVTTPA